MINLVVFFLVKWSLRSDWIVEVRTQGMVLCFLSNHNSRESMTQTSPNPRSRVLVLQRNYASIDELVAELQVKVENIGNVTVATHEAIELPFIARGVDNTVKRWLGVIGNTHGVAYGFHESPQKGDRLVLQG